MKTMIIGLMEVSLTASFMIAAVLIFRFFLKKTKAPAWMTCSLWALVALRLIMPFTIESPFSLIPENLSIQEQSTSVKKSENTANPLIFAHAVNPAANPTVNSTEVSGKDPASDKTSQGVQFSENDMTSTVSHPSRFVDLWFVLGVIWLVGFVGLLGYGILCYWQMHRQVAASIPVEENIRICDEISTPFIFGLFKPVIYLPSSLPEESMGAVLEHEKAHLQRRDPWWKMASYILLALHWMNPLCWIAYVLFGRDIETACDEKVVKTMDKAQKIQYSQILLNCSTPGKWISACPLAFGEIGVKERVKNVLTYQKPRLGHRILGACACVVAALCFLTSPKLAASSDQNQEEIDYNRFVEAKGYAGYLEDTAVFFNRLQVQFIQENADQLSMVSCLRPDCTHARGECNLYLTDGNAVYVSGDYLYYMDKDSKTRHLVLRRMDRFGEKKEDVLSMETIFHDLSAELTMQYVIYQDKLVFTHCVKSTDPRSSELQQILMVDLAAEEKKPQVLFDRSGKMAGTLILSKVFESKVFAIEINPETKIESLWMYDLETGKESLVSDMWFSRSGLGLETNFTVKDNRLYGISTGYTFPSEFFSISLEDFSKEVYRPCEEHEAGASGYDESHLYLTSGAPILGREPVDPSLQGLYIYDYEGNLMNFVSAENQDMMPIFYMATKEYVYFAEYSELAYSVKPRYYIHKDEIGTPNLKIYDLEHPETAESVITDEDIKETYVTDLATYYELNNGLWACYNTAEAESCRKPDYYQYKVELTGTMNHAAGESTLICLTNRSDLTFEEVTKSMFSSYSGDLLDPSETVLVGWFMASDESTSADGQA